VIRRAARRLFLPVALIACSIAVVAAVAVLAGSPLQRASALGLYGVGSFVAIVGFALGSRGLFRSPDDGSLDAGAERLGFWETTAVAALLIVIGIVLLAGGVAVDPRVRLI
jgi:hypothetical protein